MLQNFKCAFTSRSLFFESTKWTTFGFSGLGPHVPPTRDAKLQNAIIAQEARIISCFLITATLCGNDTLHARASRFHQSYCKGMNVLFFFKQEQCFGGKIKLSFCKTKQQMPLWSIVPPSCFYLFIAWKLIYSLSCVTLFTSSMAIFLSQLYTELERAAKIKPA